MKWTEINIETHKRGTVYGVLSHKRDICFTPPTFKAQGLSQKKDRKGCKSQRLSSLYRTAVLLN